MVAAAVTPAMIRPTTVDFFRCVWAPERAACLPLHPMTLPGREQGRGAADSDVELETDMGFLPVSRPTHPDIEILKQFAQVSALRSAISGHTGITGGILISVSNALEWIAAIGGVAATVGAWLGPVRSRWQLRAEQLRTDRARWENQLHRQRFADIWGWQRCQSDGPERTEAVRWFAEWTGTARPRRGGLDAGPQIPGLHSGDLDGAYESYVQFLGAVYEPGHLGAPAESLHKELPD